MYSKVRRLSIILLLFMSVFLIACDQVEEVTRKEYTFTLIGEKDIYLELGTSYQEQGVIALNNNQEELQYNTDCVVDEDWICRSIQFLKSSGKSAVGGSYNLRENPSFFEIIRRKSDVS